MVPCVLFKTVEHRRGLKIIRLVRSMAYHWDLLFPKAFHNFNLIINKLFFGRLTYIFNSDTKKLILVSSDHSTLFQV